MALAARLYVILYLGSRRIHFDAVDGASEGKQGSQGEDGLDRIG